MWMHGGWRVFDALLDPDHRLERVVCGDDVRQQRDGNEEPEDDQANDGRSLAENSPEGRAPRAGGRCRSHQGLAGGVERGCLLAHEKRTRGSRNP